MQVYTLLHGGSRCMKQRVEVITCRLLQTVPGHVAVRPATTLSQAGAGQDISQHKGRGCEEQSHGAMSGARLFICSQQACGD